MTEEGLPLVPIPRPEEFEEMLSGLTPGQKRYLSMLPLSKDMRDASRMARVSWKSVPWWRRNILAFRRAEALIKQYASDYGKRLAENIAKSAAPTVMQKMVERATGDPQSDRELVTSQRAGETVLKAAGTLTESGLPEGVERIDIVAMRLWKQSKTQLEPPSERSEEERHKDGAP